MKTMHEVLKETGLSYPVLNHLKDLGIIPKPKLKGQGRGRGVVGVFEDDVIEIINWVKNQREKGLTLPQIAEKRRDEVAGIDILIPTEEYLSPMTGKAVESYVNAFSGFHDWIKGQIELHMPGREFHSVELEVIKKRGKEFLKVKKIKVRPKADTKPEEDV